MLLVPGVLGGLYAVVVFIIPSRISLGILLLATMVVTWLWALLIIRWRLTGARLLPWRLPVIALAFPLMLNVLVPVLEEAEAFHLRQTQPELLDMTVLDHPDWELTSFRLEGGYHQTYDPVREQNAGRGLSLRVPPQRHAERQRTKICGDHLEACEARGDLLLKIDEDSGHASEALVEFEGELVILGFPNPSHDETVPDLAELSEHLRPSTTDDHPALSRVLYRR